MGERMSRKLPRVLLSLIAALVLAFAIGYIGVSGFGGEPIGVEKASAYPGDPYVQDIAQNAFLDSADYWYSVFVDNGIESEWGNPKLYWVYDEPISYACDGGVLYPEEGPMYCGANWGIYYQVDFVAKEYGDGAVAATVAHEMGHHVQNLLGIPHMYSYTKELEADCLAGVYMANAWHRGLVDDGDYHEAYEMFGAIGDDAAWNEEGHHGTGPERQEWFESGWETEDPAQCRTTI
jgi:predicted metalloprotease